MAHIDSGRSGGRYSDRMMNDSGITAYMTAQAERVSEKTACEFSVQLADNSGMHSESMGRCPNGSLDDEFLSTERTYIEYTGLS